MPPFPVQTLTPPGAFCGTEPRTGSRVLAVLELAFVGPASSTRRPVSVGSGTTSCAARLLLPGKAVNTCCVRALR